MNTPRRTIIASLACGVASLTTGCGNRPNSNVKKQLQLRLLEPPEKSSTWTLTVQTEVPFDYSISGVRLVAFTARGELTGEFDIGTMSLGGRTDEFSCSSFPAIITATTAVPCEDIVIDLFYWTTLPDHRDRDLGWEKTTRGCADSLPSRQILDKVRTRTGQRPS